MERDLNQKQINALIADDESSIGEMIRFTLRKSGLTVQCAANGREALDKINDTKPDILLLDWMMSHMSRPELTWQLVQCRL